MKYWCMIFYCCCTTVFAQPVPGSLLQDLLTKNGTPLIREILGAKDSFRVQIIYTQIDRDKNNQPSFTNYYFNKDTSLYFNPASTVKLPLALLALEKLNDLGVEGVNKYTAIQIDSNKHWQTAMYSDSTANNQLPSIAHFIKKALLVSDNDAYNRLYQFIGQQAINQRLREKGYPRARITRQFAGLTTEQNRYTNAIRFIRTDAKLLYHQPGAYNTDSVASLGIVKMGRAHYNSKDSLVNEPIDFTMANRFELEDLQRVLQAAMFPASVPASQRFRLTKDDYTFLYQYLSQYPSETNYPKYDSASYYDSYVKFYFRKEKHSLPPQVRVFNKVGWAYGFLIDVSYVADFKNKIEYMLTSTVYVNSDGVLNDNKYDYKNIGWPFLYDLGQTIYQHELQRKRLYAPNLDRFRVKYEKRNTTDTRPTIKKVDN